MTDRCFLRGPLNHGYNLLKIYYKNAILRGVVSKLAALLILVFIIVGPSVASGIEPSAKIRDNSFLVEEGYNQEAGVLHNIQSFWYSRDESWLYYFTQEWPVPNEKHQLSYTIPVNYSGPSLGDNYGIGDVALNYRYQLILTDKMGFAPRLSLLLPTGSVDDGVGRGSVGLQVGLPFSIDLSEKFWSSNWNLGGMFTPQTKFPGGHRENTYDFYAGGNIVLFAHTNFNLLTELVYYNIENYDATGNTWRDQSLYLNPGIRFAINFDCGLQIVPGFAVPIGIGPSRGAYGIFGYLSFEFPIWHPKQKDE
jgi:hypothetical protein